MIRVHLVTFNHEIFGIVDQIRFLKLLFRQLKIPFSWGAGFSSNALNIFIEFTDHEKNKIVMEFFRKTGKRLGYIFTEHVYIEDEILYFNTIPSNIIVQDDYMGQSTAFSRFYHFLELLPYARKIYTLGDYPDTRWFGDIKIQKEVIGIPFPPVHGLPRASPRPERPREFDFVFTGSRTSHRARILSELERHFKVKSLQMAANEHERGSLYRNTSFILNIPQNAQWSWSSPMRIFAALRYGRTVISLQTHQGSAIDAYAIHLEEKAVVDAMASLIERGAPAAEDRIISKYNRDMSAPERWEPLRRDLRHWAIEEGLA